MLFDKDTLDDGFDIAWPLMTFITESLAPSAKALWHVVQLLAASSLSIREHLELNAEDKPRLELAASELLRTSTLLRNTLRKLLALKKEEAECDYSAVAATIVAVLVAKQLFAEPNPAVQEYVKDYAKAIFMTDCADTLDGTDFGLVLDQNVVVRVFHCSPEDAKRVMDGELLAETHTNNDDDDDDKLAQQATAEAMLRAGFGSPDMPEA